MPEQIHQEPTGMVRRVDPHPTGAIRVTEEGLYFSGRLTSEVRAYDKKVWRTFGVQDYLDRYIAAPTILYNHKQDNAVGRAGNVRAVYDGPEEDRGIYLEDVFLPRDIKQNRDLMIPAVQHGVISTLSGGIYPMAPLVQTRTGPEVHTWALLEGSLAPVAGDWKATINRHIIQEVSNRLHCDPDALEFEHLVRAYPLLDIEPPKSFSMSGVSSIDVLRRTASAPTAETTNMKITSLFPDSHERHEEYRVYTSEGNLDIGLLMERTMRLLGARRSYPLTDSDLGTGLANAVELYAEAGLTPPSLPDADEESTPLHYRTVEWHNGEQEIVLVRAALRAFRETQTLVRAIFNRKDVMAPLMTRGARLEVTAWASETDADEMEGLVQLMESGASLEDAYLYFVATAWASTGNPESIEKMKKMMVAVQSVSQETESEETEEAAMEGRTAPEVETTHPTQDNPTVSETRQKSLEEEFFDQIFQVQ